MFELVYFSTANPGLSSTDISNIIESSIKFNGNNNITGCLIYSNGEFLQLLEGEKEIVQNLFDKIKKDKRHKNVILLGEDSKDLRLFPKWSMAFQNLDSDSEKTRIFKHEIITISELTNKPTQVAELFWAMAKHIVS
jgi:hypothetical protein